MQDKKRHGTHGRHRGTGAVLTAGAALGLAADRLLWEGPTGPGLALWVALLGGVGAWLARQRGWRWGPATVAWAGVAVAAAALTAWRASPVLQLLSLLTLIVAASVVLLEARRRRFGRTRVVDHLWGLALVPWRGALGAGPLLADLRPPELARRRAAALGRGAVLAAPPVVAFGLLFAAADPAFEGLLAGLLPDSEELAAHLFLTVGLGWVSVGLLTGLYPGGRSNPLRALRPPPLGVEEMGMVLGLVVALFALFVAVQFRYLFGGAAAIETISGLTAAEYARRGFFELVAVTALVLALLLAAATSGRRGRGKKVFRWLAAPLLGLVAVVIASAAFRLGLYVGEFGLTTARLYAAAFMTWLAFTLVLFAATVLRGRPRAFATYALVAGLALVPALAILNPDALVVRTNLSRTTDRPVDAEYLSSLSADAVPALVQRLDAMAPESRCVIVQRLVGRWAEPGTPRRWTAWNAAEARARHAITALNPCPVRAAVHPTPERRPYSMASLFTRPSASRVSFLFVSPSSSSVCCSSSAALSLPSVRAYVRAVPYAAIS